MNSNLESPHERNGDMHRPLRVLMVEDSEVMTNYVMSTVSRSDAGIVFVPASTLASGLALMASEKFDAVLLDLFLPDAEEAEAITKMRHIHPDIVIVVMTGMGGDLEDAVMQAGADDYLEKGSELTPRQIVKAVRHAVIRKEVRRKFQEVHDSMMDTQRALETAAEIERIHDSVIKG